MKIETVPKEPNVAIMLSWKEARVLRSIVGAINGGGHHRPFTDELFEALRDIGCKGDCSVNFTGHFQ